jgi:hypothetical protein
MRGRIAAACAAVLVGLAPAGFLVSAPWLSPTAWSYAAPAPSRETRRLVSTVPVLAVSAESATQGFAEVPGEPLRAEPQQAPVIWRSPSGPAPSQAPPAV